MQKGGKVRKKGRKTGFLWIEGNAVKERLRDDAYGYWSPTVQDFLAEYVEV